MFRNYTLNETSFIINEKGERLEKGLYKGVSYQEFKPGYIRVFEDTDKYARENTIPVPPEFEGLVTVETRMLKTNSWKGRLRSHEDERRYEALVKTPAEIEQEHACMRQTFQNYLTELQQEQAIQQPQQPAPAASFPLENPYASPPMSSQFDSVPDPLLLNVNSYQPESNLDQLLLKLNLDTDVNLDLDTDPLHLNPVSVTPPRSPSPFGFFSGQQQNTDPLYDLSDPFFLTSPFLTSSN